MESECRVECVADETRFQELACDWNRLADRTDPCSVFLRHEWFDSAWQWQKLEVRLYVLCVICGDKLTGIFPTVARDITDHGLRITQIEFLSVPDTQECDILAASSDRILVAEALAIYMSNNVREWARMDLSKLRWGSRCVQLLGEILQKHGMFVLPSDGGHNATVPLKGAWREYYSRRSRRLKKGNNYVANRLKRSHRRLDIKWINPESRSCDAMTTTLYEVIRISSHSWKYDTGLTLNNEGPNRFIKRLTEHANRQGWLSIWMLFVDNEPAAMEYQLIYKGVVSALRADYDQAFEGLSPGTYLNWKLLEQLFGKQLDCYCMGPGDNPYKSRWTEDYKKLDRLMIYSRTWRGRLLNALEVTLKGFMEKVRYIGRNIPATK